MIDDISGEEIADGAGETVSFALDGQTYSIDLTKKNADTFRGLFMDYVAVATKTGRKTATRGAKTQSGSSAKEIRDWARSNNLDVPERGRIPESVRAAFDSAN